MSGKIIAIFVAPSKHAKQIPVDAVQLKAGKGIVGDRFFGSRQKQPGRNLTLIEWEAIEEFNGICQLNLPLNSTRRNFITQGIRLNDLLGIHFNIGNLQCRGIELCEPCNVMARHFPDTPLSHSNIISAFTQKGGIRAAVLTDGVVRLGDEILL